jgi:hypothetical protein
MAKTFLTEFHLTVFVLRGLRQAEYRAIRPALTGCSFRRRLGGGPGCCW